MEADKLTTLKGIAEFAKAPPHRIIHICERGLVRPVVPAEGRGTVRKFDRENTFRIVLALYLEDLGLQHDLIRLLMDGIDELLKTSEIKARIDPTVDVDAAAIFDRLGDFDNPAMGLVVLQNSGEHVLHDMFRRAGPGQGRIRQIT